MSDLCTTCAVGYYLPSEKCDHCDSMRSAPAPSVPPAPQGSLRCDGVVGLRVESADVLEIAANHETEADRLERIAAFDGHTDRMRTHCARKAAIERLCSEVLLRHAVSMIERQPEPNTPYQPRPGA